MRRTTVPYVVELHGVAILAVDDDADNLEIISYVVGQEGGSVRSARSASSALEILLDWTPDLLLFDLSMPDVDGFELLTTVRAIARLHLVPAIAVTAHAFEADKQRCLEAGFVRHISKPYDPNDLLIQIAQVVGSEARQPSPPRTP
jgi:CheY-like chemotaxis protein